MITSPISNSGRPSVAPVSCGAERHIAASVPDLLKFDVPGW